MSRRTLFALGFLALIVVWVSYSWLVIVSAVKSTTEDYGVSVVEGLQLDKPELQTAFKESLWGLRKPTWLLQVAGRRLWVILLGTTAAGALWLAGWRKRTQKTDHVVRTALVATPALLGLGFYPWDLRDAFDALAQAGLSAPDLVGAGMAEAWGPAVFGTLMSLLLLCLHIGLSRWQRAQDETAPSTDG